MLQCMEASDCLGLTCDTDCCLESLQWSTGDIFRAVHNYGPIVLAALKTKLARQVTCPCRHSHAAGMAPEISSKNLTL